MSEEIEDTKDSTEESPEDFVSFGQTWEELEAQLESDDLTEESAMSGKELGKTFFLSKEQIAEVAHDASVGFRDLVEDFEGAGESIKTFSELSEEDKLDWIAVTLLALRSQGAPDEDFARTLHSKQAMGLLLKGVKFDEKFIMQSQESSEVSACPMVAPWECLPPERQIPLLIFKATVKQLYRVWDKDNDLLRM